MEENILQNDNISKDSRLLVRAIMILESISLCQQPAGVHQIGKMTGIHPTTVFRIVRTLCKYGWLIQHPDSKYSIGMSIHSIGSQFNIFNDLKEVSFFTMQKLSDSIGQPVNLMVRQNNTSILIQQTHSKNVYNTLGAVGSRTPLYITACGKVLLSGLTDTLLELIIDSFDFHQYTPNTIGNRDELIKAIKNIRRTKFAIDDQEAMCGAFCVAVPISDELDEIIAAISVTSVINFQKYQEEYIEALKKAAQKIKQDLIKHRTERGFFTASLKPSRYDQSK